MVTYLFTVLIMVFSLCCTLSSTMLFFNLSDVSTFKAKLRSSELE